MIIAISASGATEKSELDTRFGRAAWFVLYDTDTEKYSAIPNEQNLNLPQGAGIQSASLVVNAGATVLISSHCGPKAFDVLKKGGVKIYLAADGTVEECLEKYRKRLLKETESADVDGHW
jgi:predicted Fe-Mo cluster-binding NifX family protein